MEKKLSRTHKEVLSQLIASVTAQLHRLPGGFWVVDPDIQEYTAGEWSVSGKVVTDMITLGYLSPISDKTHAPCVITDNGISALNAK